MYAVVTKKFWYAVGGFSNPRCYRKHTGRCWRYLMTCIVIMLLPLNALAMEHVARVDALPGETREDMTWRIAATMDAWTRQHDAEVCGTITDTGIDLYTLRLQLHCDMPRMDGTVIHTHPHVRNGKMRLHKGTLRRLNYDVSDIRFDPLEVSEADYHAGAGLVVGGGQLIEYADGVQRSLGALP